MSTTAPEAPPAPAPVAAAASGGSVAPSWSRAYEPAPARPRPGVVMAEGLAAAREAVSRAARAPGTGMSNAELSAAAQDLAALTSQVQALSMAVLAQAQDRGQAGPVGDGADPDPAAWLGKLTGDPAEILRGGLWVVKRLQSTYHHTRRGLEDGRLRLSQAKAIVRAAEHAPRTLSPEQIAEAEASLVVAATGEGSRTGRPMSAKLLRAEARRTFAHLLGTKPEADAAEGDDVAADEDHAERETYLSLGDRGDGTRRGTLVLPDLHARLLIHALEHLIAPRRMTRDHTGRCVTDEAAEVIGASWGERMGSALCELLEHLPTDHLRHGTAIALLVKAPLETLRTGLGVGALDDGVPTSARTLRRLACNAGHIPVVLSGESLPLDLGRMRRLFGPAQSHALAATHDTCAITGCARPFTWCELHHLQPWSHAGRTDLANALPLCGYHHRRVHDPTYQLRPHPDHAHHYLLRRRQ